MTIITKEDIERCIGCDLTDILERAGVQVRRFNRNFHQSSDSDAVYVALRGMADTQTLLLVNGVRQEDNMLSEPLWTFIPVHHIERIEVVKGPQSAFYGDSAIGGVIHIFTQKSDCFLGEFCITGGVSFSSESTTGNTAYASAEARTEQSGIRIGFQGDRSEDSEKTDDYEERFLNFHFDHRSKDYKWLIESSGSFYNSNDKGEPEPTLERGISDIVSFGTTYYLSPHLLFKALLGYNREQQRYTDEDNTEYTGKRLSIKLLGQYFFEFADGNYILTAGVEKQRERINSNPDNVYDYKKRDTKAVFTTLAGNQGRFIYQLAARIDDLSGDIKEQVFTWSGAASYRLAEINSHNVFLRSAVGTGFRAPGFDEQYLRRFSYSSEDDVLGTSRRGDPDLKLEKSTTYEVGLRIEKDDLYFLDVSSFKTELEDPVSIGERRFLRRTTGENPLIVYLVPLVQQEEAYIHGVEVQGQFTKGPLKWYMQYTYTETDDTENLRAHNPATHLGSLGIDYSFDPKLTSGITLTHRGKREDDSPPGDKVNLLDLHSYYNINKNARLGIALKNLTNKKYDMYNFTDGSKRAAWILFEVY